MISSILELLSNNPSGSLAIGGGGIVTLVLALHKDVKVKMKEDKAETKEFIEMRLQPITTENDNLKLDITETKQMVRDLHNHLLNKRSK